MKNISKIFFLILICVVSLPIFSIPVSAQGTDVNIILPQQLKAGQELLVYDVPDTASDDVELYHEMSREQLDQELDLVGTYSSSDMTDENLRISNVKGLTYIAVFNGSERLQEIQSSLFDVREGINTIRLKSMDPRGLLFIRKIDGDTGETLEGVEFKIQNEFGTYGSYLFDQEGQHTTHPSEGSEHLLTNADGEFTLSDLPAGEYLLIEVEPLDGYTNADPVEFTITPGDITELEILNFKEEDPPVDKDEPKPPVDDEDIPDDHSDEPERKGMDTGIRDLVANPYMLIAIGLLLISLLIKLSLRGESDVE